MTTDTPRTEIVKKLRYMARQYTNGSIARGGKPSKHYLDEAADAIETLTEELSATQDARNVLLEELKEAKRVIHDYEISVPNATIHSLQQELESSEAKLREAERDAVRFVYWYHHSISLGTTLGTTEGEWRSKIDAAMAEQGKHELAR